MWNNRHSFFLLVAVKQRNKVRLVIPLCLPVLEITLHSLCESLEVWEKIFPRITARIKPKRINPTSQQLRLSPLLALCRRLLHQLRHYGAMEIVQVDDGETLVSVRLV